MIDFERIVERLLLELGEDGSTPANAATPAPASSVTAPSTVDISVDPTVAYFTTPNEKLGNISPYIYFANKFKEKYKKLPLSSENDLQRLISALKGSSDKNQLNISPFVEYTEAFPLIDFILSVAATTIKDSKGNLNIFETEIKKDQKVANGAVKSYIERFEAEAKVDGWPLDYSAVTSQARTLEIGLRKKLADNVVGTLAYQNHLNKSIYLAVTTMLKAREDIRNKGALGGLLQSTKFLDEILYGDYNKYASGGPGGKEMISGKYARMWDQYSVDKLYNIGKSIRNFYNYEKALHVPPLSEEDKKTSKEQALIPTVEQLVKNDINGKRFTLWSLEPKVESLSFDDTFNCLFNEMLLLEQVSWYRLKDGKQTKVDSNTKGVIKFTIVDKININKPDPNYEPIYITHKELLDIYNKNKEVQQEVAQYKSQQNKLYPQFNTNEQALFGYFSTAKGPVGTEEKHLDKLVRDILQQRLKDALQKKLQSRLKNNQPLNKETAEIPESGYTLGYIETLSHDSAKDLVNKLKDLGDYIGEKKPFDWEKANTFVDNMGLGTKMHGT